MHPRLAFLYLLLVICSVCALAAALGSCAGPRYLTTFPPHPAREPAGVWVTVIDNDTLTNGRYLPATPQPPHLPALVPAARAKRPRRPATPTLTPR